MEQSPSWEGNWLSASQEIPLTVWKPKVCYRIHKSPPAFPILSQINPVLVMCLQLSKDKKQLLIEQQISNQHLIDVTLLLKVHICSSFERSSKKY
jgi:hypothetical protein